MCTAVEMLPMVSGKKPRISHPVTQQQSGEREREDDEDEMENEKNMQDGQMNGREQGGGKGEG